MKRETIVYRGKSYHRYPESDRRQLWAYFWRHDKNKRSPVSLHRQVYIDNFGCIDPGMVIHHKDGDTLNNDPKNLECISASQHMSNHASTKERIEKSKRNMKLASIASKKWHGSDEGRKWHREQALRSARAGKLTGRPKKVILS